MGFTQFPDIQRLITFETSELVQLGRFKVAETTELKYIVARLFKKGTAGGSETLTLKIYGSSDYAGTAYATSAAVTLASITGLSATNSNGDARFVFDRQNLNPNSWYYVAMSTASYTRNGDTYYLAAVRDWPFPFNTVSGAGPAARFTIHGYRE